MARKKSGGTQKQAGARPSRRSGKGGAWWQVLAVALLTVVAGLILLSFFGSRFFKPAPVKKIESPPHAVKEPVKGEISVDLYFISEDGTHLKAEKRGIGKGEPLDEAKETLTALFSGPKPENSGLIVTVPEGTRLLGLTIKDGVAYVNISREVIEKHWGGSSAEIQTVYSIVNTLAMNFPEIKKVQILVDGKKESTIAGHIDITRPLAPDRKLIVGLG
ncbi:MAG: GerMN domain-containing protein [Deltaproteobacteria bacterium]|nr:GerMN domain-containing protein [Deltaproteobacteria bacterium]